MSKHDAEIQKMKEYLDHCRRKLERCVKDKPLIFATLQKLSKVPVTPEVLEATGILKTLSALSNLQDENSDRALSLFNKWKMIMDSQKRNKEIPGKMLNHTPAAKLIGQKASDNYVSSRPFSSASVVGNKGMSELPKRMPVALQKDISSNSTKCQIFSDKFDLSRPCTSSTISNNDIIVSAHNTNNKMESHSLDKSEDYLSNPHLSISTDNFDDLADSPTKNKIVEPYAIDMKEGMFKVVKMNPDDIPPYILRVRQLYDKALIKNNRELPSKRERDKDVCENDFAKTKSPLKSGNLSPINPKKSKKNAHSSAVSKNSDKSDSSESDSNFHSEHKNIFVEKSLKGKNKTFETSCINSDDRLRSVKRDLSLDRSEKEQKQVTEKRVKSKSSELSKPADKLKQQSPAMIKNIHDKSNSPNLTGFTLLNVESHQRTCDKMPSDRSVLSDEDPLRFATSKKERTSVYSGKKKVQDVPPLSRCCTQVLRKNLEYFRLTRKVPFKYLEPVLQYCTPVQLRKLEEANVPFLSDTSELWKAHCQREHRDKIPAKHETWKHMYWRVHEEQNRKLKNLAANISASRSHPERHVKLTEGNGKYVSPRQIRPTENRSLIIVDSPVIHRSSPKQAKLSSPIENKMSAKSTVKKVLPVLPVKKTVKKESDAPLMSKVKKFMGLASKYKK